MMMIWPENKVSMSDAIPCVDDFFDFSFEVQLLVQVFWTPEQDTWVVSAAAVPLSINEELAVFAKGSELRGQAKALP